MFNRLLAATLAACTLTAPVMAEIPEKPFYIGINYGAGNIYTGAKYHVDGYETVGNNGGVAADYNARVSKPSATELSAGFRITERWAVETRMMMTGLLDAPFFIGNEEIFNEATLKANAYGLYGVFHAGTDVYVRAKLGLSQSSINLSGKDVNADYSSLGLSYGISAGKKLGDLGAFEISYMRYADATADKNDTCLILEPSLEGSPTCVPDAGAKRYIQVNEKMRLNAITVGYTFIF